MRLIISRRKMRPATSSLGVSMLESAWIPRELGPLSEIRGVQMALLQQPRQGEAQA